MTKYGQPVISRETRLLLITIAVSIVALWVLARLRFQERPVTAAPVPPVLAQLRPATSFADLAGAIADIRPVVVAALFEGDGGVSALRIREEAAVALVSRPTASPLASDRATGLSIVKSAPGAPPGLMPWVPRLLDYPRYLVAAELIDRHLSLRPIFVGGLFATASPLWSGEIWSLPPATALVPGTFVFTTDGALAGLGVEHNGRPAIVPATLLLKFADGLLLQQRRDPGDIGVAVQPLSTAIAAATGDDTGVVVTAVDPNGPAAGRLIATDVIEAVDGHVMFTVEHWRARIARLDAGQTLSLRVRGSGEVRDVAITAVAPAPLPEAPEDREQTSLGLRTRAIPKVGVEVLSVAPRSRAARSAIRAGDIITVAGRETAPTPTQVTEAFDALPERGALLVAITRRNERLVVVIEK